MKALFKYINGNNIIGDHIRKFGISKRKNKKGSYLLAFHFYICGLINLFYRGEAVAATKIPTKFFFDVQKENFCQWTALVLVHCFVSMICPGKIF